MGSKRVLIPAFVACAALAGAGVAAATHRTASAQGANAAFATSAVTNLKQTTCSISGGDSFQGTAATYVGTATSADPRLTGVLTIRARSVIDTTTGNGRVAGVFKIVGANGTARGVINAAVSGGQADGLARGEIGRPAGHLVASLSSGFDPSSGFSSGSLGSGSSGGNGVVISGGYCRHAVVHHSHGKGNGKGKN